MKFRRQGLAGQWDSSRWPRSNGQSREQKVLKDTQKEREGKLSGGYPVAKGQSKRSRKDNRNRITFTKGPFVRISEREREPYLPQPASCTTLG